MKTRQQLLDDFDEKIANVRQLLTDIESWNDNRPECPPIDCEVERVYLALATKARDSFARNDPDWRERCNDFFRYCVQVMKEEIAKETAHG